MAACSILVKDLSLDVVLRTNLYQWHHYPLQKGNMILSSSLWEKYFAPNAKFWRVFSHFEPTPTTDWSQYGPKFVEIYQSIFSVNNFKLQVFSYADIQKIKMIVGNSFITQELIRKI